MDGSDRGGIGGNKSGMGMMVVLVVVIEVVVVEVQVVRVVIVDVVMGIVVWYWEK